MSEETKVSQGIPKAPAVIGLLLVTAGVLGAADPPHWSGQQLTIDCTSQCHTGHQAPGSVLTAAAGNVNLCQSCHNPAGDAAAMSISTSDAAQPGVKGTSHAFDKPDTDPGMGASTPTSSEMVTRVMEGNIVCSTCHNQHFGLQANGGTPRVRPAQKVTALGSTGDLTPGGTFSGPNGLWYLIEITTAGSESTAGFRFSKDNGISWTPIAPAELNAGTDVGLDFGVTVTFETGNYVLGERWEFAAAWPFLRVPLDSGANGAGDEFCRDCHRDWVMEHGPVESYDGNPKSHPVGIVLNANGRGYDRVAPLDGDGSGDDGIAGNDLILDAENRVQCLTCHGVHYADSNTTTPDGG